MQIGISGVNQPFSSAFLAGWRERRSRPIKAAVDFRAACTVERSLLLPLEDRVLAFTLDLVPGEPFQVLV